MRVQFNQVHLLQLFDVDIAVCAGDVKKHLIH